MYVLLVRPQQRKVREQRDLVRRVGVGAEVQTIGGILGRVVAADDEYVHLEISPGVVVTFVRAAVGRILEAAPDEAEADWDSTPEQEQDGTAADDAGEASTSVAPPGPADPGAAHHVELPPLHEEEAGPDTPATGTGGAA